MSSASDLEQLFSIYVMPAGRRLHPLRKIHELLNQEHDQLFASIERIVTGMAEGMPSDSLATCRPNSFPSAYRAFGPSWTPPRDLLAARGHISPRPWQPSLDRSLPTLDTNR